MPKAKTTIVPIDEITLDQKNSRVRDGKARKALKDSVGQFGAARSLVMDSEGVIRAGNGTLEAAREAGIKEAIIIETDGKQLVVVKRPDWTPEEALAYALSDNRTGELSGWDVDVLGDALDDLMDADFDFAGAGELDFDGLKDQLEQERMIAAREEAKEIATPDLPEDPITKPGDRWHLGEHRLMCGDSLDPGVVDSMVGGVNSYVVVLDPPFNFPSKVWRRFIHDPCVVFGQMKQMRLIPRHLYRFERIIAKGKMHRIASTHVGAQHSFVVQCGTDRVCPDDAKTYGSVISVETPEHHRWEKPVDLIIEHLTVWMAPWKMVFDPFLGSGTTLIAAERLNRLCYGIELDPAYCDVIVERWENLTGGKAKKA